MTFAKGSQGQLKVGCPQKEEWQEAAGTGLIPWEFLKHFTYRQKQREPRANILAQSEYDGQSYLCCRERARTYLGRARLAQGQWALCERPERTKALFSEFHPCAQPMANKESYWKD